jgi:hypothetical protein
VVSAAIIFSLLFGAACFLSASSIIATQRREHYKELEDVADGWKTRYDDLVEKVRERAKKPDKGVIHARNSGDVRRVFEQEVARSMAEIDKEMEN